MIRRNLCTILLASILLFSLQPFVAPPGGGKNAVQAAVQTGSQPTSTMSNVYLPLIGHLGGAFGSLENGGTYQGEGGVGVGAPDNTLGSPINVSIIKTADPGLALPSQVHLLTDYFKIRASTLVDLNTGAPLILAIPVPSGVNTANLALATFQPGSNVSDGDPGVTGWSYQEGMYDATNKLFLTTISSLTTDGNTFTLVEHPDFDSPPNKSSPVRSTGLQPQASTLFKVRCIGFTNPTDCTTDTENQVADYLTQIYDHYKIDLGFPEPRLRFLDESVDYNPPRLSQNGYTTYIEPFNFGFCGNDAAAGYYEPGGGRLVLCLNPGQGLNNYYLHVLIHEFFHAIQYAHTVVLTEYMLHLDERWPIEGMAKAAEESYFSAEMLRSQNGGWEKLHSVDMSLKSEFFFDEYDAQDFWVYYGQKTHQGLIYLNSVLNGGVQVSDVARTIGSGNYLDPYWDWAKNQAEEAQITFGGALSNPCKLNQKVVDKVEDFNYQVYNQPYYDTNVPALTTKVVSIHWDHNYTGAWGHVFAPLGQPAKAADALRYKFYVDGESGCESVPDNERVYDHPDMGKTYYVLISNIDPMEMYTYRIGFEVSPVPPP